MRRGNNHYFPLHQFLLTALAVAMVAQRVSGFVQHQGEAGSWKVSSRSGGLLAGYSAKRPPTVRPILSKKHGDEDEEARRDSIASPYERLKKTMSKSAKKLDYVLENNKKWADDCVKEDPEIFMRLRDAQSPTILYIGCSDSRCPAQNMLGLTTGELFVHRNVANMCISNDMSLLSVLTFAVDYLEVDDIIVCGHYGCGGVKAAMENKDHGLLEHWLENIRQVRRLHMDELLHIEDKQARLNRLVELNVQEQCINLYSNSIVQRKQALEGKPRIHGWVYELSTGYVKDLKIDFRSEIRKYKHIYGLYQFKDDEPSNGTSSGTDGTIPSEMRQQNLNGSMTPRKQ
jgi:carbonic anhydrase